MNQNLGIIKEERHDTVCLNELFMSSSHDLNTLRGAQASTKFNERL